MEKLRRILMGGVFLFVCGLFKLKFARLNLTIST